VIDYFPGFPHVILATGHYRNGVLLAPATADRVRVLMGLGDRLEILKDPDGTAPSP
jgi:glycine/D-amino acid oxidase-like deaminating enzyme